MQRRILIVFGLLGALAAIVLLIALLLRDDAPLSVVETVAPPEYVPAPPEPEGVRARKESGNLRGKVVNGNDETPIGGATVIALRPYLERNTDDDLPLWGQLEEVKELRTNKDGTFLIEDLPPDYWNLWVEKRGYAFSTVPRAIFAKEHVIKLYPGCSVRGRVVYEDDTPAPGVRIEYTMQGTHSEVFGRYRSRGLKSYYTTTDKEGAFEYLDLPPGKFTIEVFPEDHLPAPWKFQEPLEPGENRDLGVRRLDRGFGMTVRVLQRGTNKPVPGIEVVVIPLGDPMPRTKTGRRRTTDANGVARISGLGGQVMDKPTFQVTANVPGLGPVPPDEQRSFAPGESVTIYLRRDSVIKGKVLRPNGNPLERFMVELRPRGFATRQLRSWGKDGEFRVRQVPEGEYALHVRFGNLIDKIIDVEAKPDEEVDVGTITLEEGAEVYGTVRMANGEELKGITRVDLARKIYGDQVGRFFWETVGRAYCKSDGTYRIKGVPPGQFWIWPKPEEASPTTKPQPLEMPVGVGAIERNIVIHGVARIKLKFMDEVEGQVREVVRPPTTFVNAKGEETRWMGEGQPLLGGTYQVFVELNDENGAPKRYKAIEVQVQEGETAGPIEVRLYEIRHGTE